MYACTNEVNRRMFITLIVQSSEPLTTSSGPLRAGQQEFTNDE